MKALLIVDIQNDFLPGGALAVKDSDQVIPHINRLMEGPFDIIVASKDWHPEYHGSFAPTHGRSPGEHIELKGFDQILWPIHCVQESKGAEFAAGLNEEKIEKVFFKGTEKDIDSYSAFFDNGHLKSTGLGDFLQKKGVITLFIAGLTTDYCVKYSVLDAAQLGFNVHVVIDACKPVNLDYRDEQKAVEEMKNVRAEIVTTEEVLANL
jgi:nicotinamidase/pyrazinamidase